MLYFIRDCLFRPDPLLHREFSNSLEQLIAERVTHRERGWLPCVAHDLCSLQAAVSKLQAKCVNLEAKLEGHQRKIDVLQSSTKNAAGTAATASADGAAALTPSVPIKSDLNDHKAYNTDVRRTILPGTNSYNLSKGIFSSKQ